MTVDEHGKKTPGGERNNLTQEQIAADLGTGPWLSIALKHCQDLYVVDFDTHELTGCSLHEYCTALDTAHTETNKGQHHYLYITDIPADVATLLTGSRQQKLCAHHPSLQRVAQRAPPPAPALPWLDVDIYIVQEPRRYTETRPAL
eukprot:COSAG06_NODE_450_length_15622_cov_25.221671_7_plen_146_part_00